MATAPSIPTGYFVIIAAGPPDIFSGKAKASGKDFTLVKQAAMLVHPDGKHESFTSLAPKEKDGSTKPYAPGKYALHARPYASGGELRLAPALVAVEGTK